MTLTYKLEIKYQWMVINANGKMSLIPRDEWGGSHPLSYGYYSENEAIEEYNRFIKDNLDCPDEMVLVKKHCKVIDWGDDWYSLIILSYHTTHYGTKLHR